MNVATQQRRQPASVQLESAMYARSPFLHSTLEGPHGSISPITMSELSPFSHSLNKLLKIYDFDRRAMSYGQMLHSVHQLASLYRWCTVVSPISKYDGHEVENVARGRSPSATFSTEGHHIWMSHERPCFICCVVWPTTSLKYDF